MTVPAAFALFALRFASPVLRDPPFERWLRPPFIYLLAVEPLLVTLLLWTDPWHGWFFAGQRAQNAGMIRFAGPVFWINLVYSYLLILVGFVVLILAYRRYQGVFRRQAAFVLGASLIPWVSSLAFVAGLSLLPGADHTPLSFTAAGLIFALALSRYHLLDVVPIARHVLVEKMSDGVVVIDGQNRVVDMNPAALQVLSLSASQVLGRPIEEIFSRWPDLIEEFKALSEAHAEITIPEDPLVYLDLRITPLLDPHGSVVGRLLVWRDITALKQTQAELHRLSITDALTQVANRRYFLEQAQLELERCLRYHRDMAVVVIDIDHFKAINDRYGHLTGDRVLTFFAQVCKEQIRVNDVFARLGGEEFVVLLPETGAAHAYHAAERLRQAVENSPYQVNGERITITASLGVATLLDGGDTLEKILTRADQAMYRAKMAGRNRSVDHNQL